MKIEMRPAMRKEAELCASFIDEAREYQREQGFEQWTLEYPNMDTVKEDIQKKRGYVLTEHQSPFGYLCVDFEGEPAYDSIQGEWSSPRAYAVIHRMAFGKKGRGKGASKTAFRLVKELCIAKQIHAIRVDTDEHNIGMQYILQQEGFRYCGTVIFQNSPKLAYELMF